MVSEIIIASSWGVCIPLASSSVKVIASLFNFFAGALASFLDEDSTSARGLEQPPMKGCMTPVMGHLASDGGGRRMAKSYKD